MAWNKGKFQSLRHFRRYLTRAVDPVLFDFLSVAVLCVSALFSGGLPASRKKWPQQFHSQIWDHIIKVHSRESSSRLVKFTYPSLTQSLWQDRQDYVHGLKPVIWWWNQFIEYFFPALGTCSTYLHAFFCPRILWGKCYQHIQFVVEETEVQRS